MAKRHIKLALKSVSLLTVVTFVAAFLLLSTGGRKLLSVQSGSMAPAINKGDLVSVKRVPLSELTAGDVITFVSPEGQRTITHRVVTLLPEDPAGNNVITKGDANAAVDAPIEAASVVGKVQRQVPYAGYVLDFTYSWPGLILLVYIPALTVIVAETRRLSTYYRSLRYALPEWIERRARRLRTFPISRSLISIVAGGLTLLLIALPTQAALLQSAHLTNNTISVAAPKPPPEPPDLDPSTTVRGTVSIRRVFIACADDQEKAMNAHVILYNSSQLDADVSGWILKSSGNTVITLPPDTIVQARSTYDTTVPLPEDISYASGSLTLHNQDDEQISKSTWEPQTRVDRDCRTTSGPEASDEATESSRALTEGRN